MKLIYVDLPDLLINLFTLVYLNNRQSQQKTAETLTSYFEMIVNRIDQYNWMTNIILCLSDIKNSISSKYFLWMQGKSIKQIHYILDKLKVLSCKLYHNKYMIASRQITDAEVFAFKTVLVLKLLNRKVLFIKRKDNRNC